MNEQMIEQQDSYEVLSCEVSDEALEAAGGGRGLGGVVTVRPNGCVEARG